MEISLNYDELYYTMKSITKYILGLALLVLLLVGTWFAGYKSSIFQSIEKETAEVILERIDRVAKLATVEGHFAEIFDYRQSYNNWPFEKKALVKVKARALVGYDMELLQLDIDEANQTVRISNLPTPELLSLDHDLEYYDLEDGIFNRFSPQDLTNINKRAKNFIVSKVEQSDLFGESEQQKQDFIELLQMGLKATGWTLMIDEETLLN